VVNVARPENKNRLGVKAFKERLQNIFTAACW
jgi:hypothetical protein